MSKWQDRNPGVQNAQMWSVCQEYIEKRYPNCRDSLVTFAHAVSLQKHEAAKKHQKGWRGLQALQLIGIAVAALTAVAAAFSDRHWSIKLANISGGALVTAIAATLALYNVAGVYGSELAAGLDIAELQSEMHDALVRGWAREVGTSNKVEISDDVIAKWQERLSQILRKDVQSYVDSSGTRLKSLR